MGKAYGTGPGPTYATQHFGIHNKLEICRHEAAPAPLLTLIKDGGTVGRFNNQSACLFYWADRILPQICTASA